MTEDYFNVPVLKQIFKSIWAISVPDLTKNSKDLDAAAIVADAIKALDNQKAIFGTSLNSSPMFDMQYVNAEDKLYMNVLTITDSAEYDTTTPPNA